MNVVTYTITQCIYTITRTKKRVLIFYVIIHPGQSNYEDFHEIDLTFHQLQLHSKA